MSIKTEILQLTKFDSQEIGSVIDINNNADKLEAAFKQASDAQKLHSENKNNPHGVTKAQIGLGDVDNTADYKKPISAAQQEALDGKADLGADGKVPAAQLPSYVDDVLEYSSKDEFPDQGETGKIYVAMDSNLTYRWTGSAYVEISPSIALGETSSTAYRGDRGKEAYDHSQAPHARVDATKVKLSQTNGNIKIDGVESKVYDDTELAANFDNLLDANTITAARAADIDTSGSAITILNLIEQLLLANPVVQEYDTSGWHVRKFANGRCEATIDTIVHPTTTGTAIGGIYSAVGKVNLPENLFIEAPKVKPYCRFGNGVWSEAYTTFTTHIVISLHRAAALVTAWNMPVYLEVVGKWK